MEDAKDFKEITADTLNRWLGEGKELTLIDTLPNGQFNKRHLSGAKNACVFEVTFLDQVKAIVQDRARVVVLYGSSDRSRDAVSAAEKLVRDGYREVYALKGGVSGWRRAGYSLEGERPEETPTSEGGLRFGEGVYPVDVDQSTIEWAGRNPNTKHYGTVPLSSGELIVKDGEIGGTFEIDLDSIKNQSLEGDDLQPVLIAHLKSDDFFFVERFPKAYFNIQTATPTKVSTGGSPNFEVKGVLQLRGVSREISFPATLNPLEGDGVSVEAHFDIDRTLWNVIYGSSRFFEHLGMHIVFEPISIQLHILAHKTKS